MSTSRVVHSLAVAAGICVLVGAAPGGRVRGQQVAPPQAEPTFRTDANYVLTDVFVTADGKPVTDLTQADFEVKEDGVVQTIRSFEAVRHTTEAGAMPRRRPWTVTESNAMAAIHAAACSSCSSIRITSPNSTRWWSARRCGTS